MLSCQLTVHLILACNVEVGRKWSIKSQCLILEHGMSILWYRMFYACAFAGFDGSVLELSCRFRGIGNSLCMLRSAG